MFSYENPFAKGIPARPFYTVIAPKVVRKNSEYNVAVSTSAISETSTIYIELNATLDSGDKYNISQTTIVEPNTTRVLKFEIKDTTPGRYKLVAKGLSGIQFNDTTDLQYVHKSSSVFIQTDRAIYKPGNKVLFRAVVLDSKLRPAPTGTELDVYITDGQGNRVKQWKPQMDSKGVFSGELQLSDVPVLGDWKIFVKVFDQTIEKVFEVAEYVLPKFEVTVDLPKIATINDSVITATIEAKYTNGKPVKGEATITVHKDGFMRFWDPIDPITMRKVVPIDGKVDVNFDLVSELRIQGGQEQSIRVEVTVEEALTGRSQNTSSETTLHTHKYTIKLIKSADSYKPGLKYTTFIKIANHDGSPVQDQTNPVNISYGFMNLHSSYTTISKMLDEHGMIKLEFYPPADSHTTSAPLNIRAEYLKLEQQFEAIHRALSPSGTYIQAILKTENPMVNKDIEIEVNSPVPLKYLSYEVLGRGNILVADSIQVAEKNAETFRFLATHEMAPTACVIVNYMRDDGEIVADTLEVQLKGTLANFVDISTTPQQTKPGESVDLIITSKPNSYVGLLGVDQSSVLLKSGNDISHEEVMDELKSYDTDNGSSSSNFSWGRPLWYSDEFSAFQVFKRSGTIVLTNGLVYQKPQMDYGFGASYSAPGAVFFGGVGGSLESMQACPVMPRLMSIQPQIMQVETKPKMTVRKNFPETWIWQMVDAGPDGKTVLQRSVPDTITSWMLTAFSIDSVHGFGLIEEPRKLTVFQPFFLSLDLPYSVIRGEIVAISIVVFNYMDKDITAEVVLENVGEFEFAEATNEVHDTLKLEQYRRKKINVKATSGASVSFMIIPKEIGHIVIKVKATCAMAGDSIEQKLLVKSEGETHYENKAIFIDMRDSKSFETSIIVDIPEKSVLGSEHIEVSAVGDILGPSLPNLANLIKMPFGCGEQNMLNFVPNIVVINYLKCMKQLTQLVLGKALKFLEAGYQQELTYRHVDGSFSAFGMSDARGSTWLTAFVAKSFIQAAEHIAIEEKIIKQALQWLAMNQSPEGNFPEVGTVIHRDMQGGAAKGLALTAFTLMAFLENQAYVPEYKNAIDKAIDYIVRNLEGLDDVYSLCLCAYVLSLAEHSSEDTAFKMMQSKATVSKDYKWWGKPVPQDDKNPWHSRPSSVNVEMTSYAMLSYLRRNMVAEAVPIMKWLVSQRNADGGFASTQDTIIGIYALSKLGEKLSSGTGSMGISFTYEDGGRSKIDVNAENNMVLQKHVLPRKTRKVNVSATGDGFAVIQVSYNYNLNATGAFPLFTLKPRVDENSDANHLQLSIRSGFIPTKETNESNMAVMEVNFPSGFIFDVDTLPTLKSSQHVKRVETKNGDTMVALYFDKMVKEEYCLTISAFRTHKVAKQKPVPVSIYDYYDSSRRATVFYEPRAATLSDICQGEDCDIEC